jgi:hypothetical protein
MTEYLKSCDLLSANHVTMVTVEAEGGEAIIIAEGTQLAACILPG